MKWAGHAAVLWAIILVGYSATSTKAYQAPPGSISQTPAAVPQQASQAKAALEKDAACTTCHNAATGHVLDIYQSRHGNKADPRTPSCQSCHGPSDAHMKDPTGAPATVVFASTSKHRSTPETRNAACLTCHGTDTLPRTNWIGSQHETHGVSCTDCHNSHAADQKVLNKSTQAEVCFTCHREQRAQVRHISAHPLAKTGMGSPPKMVCADCHNPHGSTGPTLLRRNSVNETCYTCHAEKRGPFLWEHAPVVENCMNCHTPHGSVNPTLLRTRAPYLCQECHSGDHAAQINSGANLGGGNVTTVNGLQQPAAAAPRAQLAARACLNCHVLIHGSNHPAGAKFQR